MIIELRTYPFWVKEGTNLKLDVSEEESLVLNQKLSDLTQGQLNLSVYVSVQLLNTDHNRYLLGNYRKGERIPCRVYEESFEHPIQELWWIEKSADGFQIQFKHLEREWAEKINNLTLQDLNYRKWGTPNATQGEIESIWNTPQWENETPPFYTPPIGYGNYQANIYKYRSLKPSGAFKDYDFSTVYNQVNVTVPDCRPLISPLFVCQEIFGKIGWQFRSTILESGFGRSIWAYLLDKDFGKGKNGQQVKFRIGLENNTPVSNVPLTDGIMYFNDAGALNPANYDPSNSATLDTNIYPSLLYPRAFFRNPLNYPAAWNITAVVNISHNSPVDPQNTPIKAIIQMYDDSNDWFPENVEFEASETIFMPSGQYRQIKVEWKNVIFLPNFRLRVKVAHDFSDPVNVSFTTSFNCYLEGTLADSAFHTGDEINPTVRKDNALDFLKGIAHAFNARFHTDYVNKTVWLYPAKNVNIFGERLEGYLLDGGVACEGFNPKETIPSQDSSKLYVGFKTGQDYRDKDEYVSIYDKNASEKDIQSDLNPYFVKVFDSPWNLKSDRALVTPFILTEELKNTTEEQNFPLFDVQPFLVLAYGRWEMQLQSGGVIYPIEEGEPYYFYSKNRTRNILEFGGDAPPEILTRVLKQNFVWFNTINTLVPYVSQLPTNKIFGNNYFYSSFTFHGRAENLGYKFHAPFLYDERTVEFITPDFTIFDVAEEKPMRKRLVVNMNGSTQHLQGIEVKDYRKGVPNIIVAKYPPIEPDYSDSYYIWRKVIQPITPASFDLLDNSYLLRCELNGVELCPIPLQAFPTPIVNTSNGLDNWRELIEGCGIKTRLTNTGNIFEIFVPKDSIFRIIISKGQDYAAFNNYIMMISEEATFQNIRFEATDGDNYCLWSQTYAPINSETIKLYKDDYI